MRQEARETREGPGLLLKDSHLLKTNYDPTKTTLIPSEGMLPYPQDLRIFH